MLDETERTDATFSPSGNCYPFTYRIHKGVSWSDVGFDRRAKPIFLRQVKSKRCNLELLFFDIATKSFCFKSRLQVLLPPNHTFQQILCVSFDLDRMDGICDWPHELAWFTGCRCMGKTSMIPTIKVVNDHTFFPGRTLEREYYSRHASRPLLFSEEFNSRWLYIIGSSPTVDFGIAC